MQTLSEKQKDLLFVTERDIAIQWFNSTLSSNATFDGLKKVEIQSSTKFTSIYVAKIKFHYMLNNDYSDEIKIMAKDALNKIIEYERNKGSKKRENQRCRRTIDSSYDEHLKKQNRDNKAKRKQNEITANHDQTKNTEYKRIWRQRNQISLEQEVV